MVSSEIIVVYLPATIILMANNQQTGKASADTLNYDHVVLKPHEQIGLHHQSTWELSYIISGRGIRRMGDTEEQFAEGEVVLVVPEMPHQWNFYKDATDQDGNIENISISFAPDVLKRMASVIPEYERMANWYDQLKASIKFTKGESSSLAAILRRMEKETVEQRINSLLQLLTYIHLSDRYKVAGHFSNPEGTDDRIKQLEIYIRCNYQQDISLSMLAQHVGMNRSSLCKYFKKCTGETLIHALQRFRIEVAKHLMATEECTIADCCYRSGFKDIPHFNHVFKEHTGITPSAFRAGIKDR